MANLRCRPESGPRGRLGSQQGLSHRSLQTNSSLPSHPDALRAETASRSGGSAKRLLPQTQPPILGDCFRTKRR